MTEQRVTSLSGVGLTILIGALVAPIAVHAQTLSPPSTAQVESAMGKVNGYWIAHHTDPGPNDWARSVYFLGDVAHYLTTGETAHLDYATNWAGHNGWGLYSGCSTAFADYQAAGRVYLALNDLAPAATKTSCITSSVNGVVSRYVNHQTLSDWYWIDALYMAMATYAELSVDKLDRTYSDAMHALYQHTKVTRGLYNASRGLWYRDGRYKPPVVSPNGKDVFWSRGNGWVFAAHADVLAQLPRDDPNYPEYLSTFSAMAGALEAVQRSDGFWNVNLADPDDYPGPETSGTALFAYGMARGIELGVLSPTEYLDPVLRAWNGLTTAIHSDGKLGFVQRAGEAPSSAQPVTADSTTDFGVGLFLLAGSAVYRLVEQPGLPNLALNRSVTCSSAPQPENGCAHTVDGDTTDRWSAQTYPQWVEADLGAVYSISGVNVYPYLDRAYHYYVEVKAGAADPYVLVADRSGNSAGGTVLRDSFAPAFARYVRLRVTGAYGYSGGWVSIRELEILGSAVPPPTNLALNRPVTCSTEPQPENGCAHAVDGDASDRWSAQAYPQWVEVDLGAVHTIRGVNVRPYMDRAYQYHVEVKTSASDPYTLVVDRSDNTQGGDLISDSFGPISARFVRLWVESASGYTGSWVSVRELEIFNW